MLPRQTKHTATGPFEAIGGSIRRRYTARVADARFLDLHGEVDKLYQAPLADFTAARNALAARIKAAHGADAAAHVKALVKPSIAAWTLNQLYWRHQPEFMALLLAGDALRLAQQQRLGGADVDLAPQTRSRQSAVDTLLALADRHPEGGRARAVARHAAAAARFARRAGRLRDRFAGAEGGPPDRGRAGARLRGPRRAGGASAGRDAGAEARPGGGSTRPEPVKLSVVARRSKEKAQAAVGQAEAALAEAKVRGGPRRRGPGQGRRRLAGGPGSPHRGPEGGRRRHHRRAGRPGRSRRAPPRQRPRRHRRPRRREAAGSGPPQPGSGLRPGGAGTGDTFV